MVEIKGAIASSMPEKCLAQTFLKVRSVNPWRGASMITRVFAFIGYFLPVEILKILKKLKKL